MRARASSRETEHPCFRLGSSSPEASSIAPTTPSLDARPTTMRERLDVALLSARVAHGRRSDDRRLLARRGARSREDRRLRRCRHRRPGRTPTARHSAPTVRTHREIRAGRARSPRTRPDRPERERQHLGTPQQPRTHRRSISRLPTHVQGNRCGALRLDQHAQDTCQADLPEARGFVPHRSGTEARRLGLF